MEHSEFQQINYFNEELYFGVKNYKIIEIKEIKESLKIKQLNLGLNTIDENEINLLFIYFTI